MAASSAFPPVLSPARLRLDPADFSRPGRSLPPPALHPRCLPDRWRWCAGNLGLRTAWKRYETILVSDAGLAMGADPDPGIELGEPRKRVLDMVDNQVRARCANR